MDNLTNYGLSVKFGAYVQIWFLAQKSAIFCLIRIKFVLKFRRPLAVIRAPKIWVLGRHVEVIWHIWTKSGPNMGGWGPRHPPKFGHETWVLVFWVTSNSVVTEFPLLPSF